MMKIFFLTTSLLLLLEQTRAGKLSLSADSSSQTSTDDALKRSYNASLDYGSNKTYSGRKDTTAQPFLSPKFIYTSKRNFYIYASAYYLQKQLDNVYLSIGKDAKVTKMFTIGYSYSHSKFLDDNTPQPAFFVPNNFDLYFKKKFRWIKTKLALDLDLGRNKVAYQQSKKKKNTPTVKSITVYDYSTTWTNYHTFYLEKIHLFSKKDELSLTPKFLITAGTQNAYLQYFKSRYPTKESVLSADPSLKKGIKKIRDLSKSNPYNNTKFLILDYEFKLSLSYTVKRFTFETIAILLIPENQPDPADDKPYAYYTFNIGWEF